MVARRPLMECWRQETIVNSTRHFRHSLSVEEALTSFAALCPALAPSGPLESSTSVQLVSAFAAREWYVVVSVSNIVRWTG